MLDYLSAAQFLEIAKTHQKIVVYQEISGDSITPVSIYYALKCDQDNATLLDSSPKEKQAGRFSFLGFNPMAEFKAQGQQVIQTIAGKTTVNTIKDPFAALRSFYTRFRAYIRHPLAGFSGGIVGLVAYDAIRYIEHIPDTHPNESQIPELHFKAFQDNITFDHQTGKVLLCTVAEASGDLNAVYQQAMDRLDQIKQHILTPTPLPTHQGLHQADSAIDNTVSVDISDEAYAKIVTRAKEYIKQGDVFQVVPSRRFQRKFSAQPFTIYRALRLLSPSPYMFYLDNKDYIIAGASPEKLISVKAGVIELCPLAGTRPRGQGTEDSYFEQALLESEKDTAEHMMLVDLARNDIGRVAAPEAVNVIALKTIQKFSHVMHLSSTVQGKLRPGLDAIDAIQAAFPAGTLSGAPKIRAMQLIDELENSRRGVYGGAICILDSQGDLDSCIAIRMAVLQNGVATVRTGAGIVFDSVAREEVAETHHKARNVLEAINLAEEGLA